MRDLLVLAACVSLAAATLVAQVGPVPPGSTITTFQITPPRDRAAQDAVPTGTAVIRGRVVVAGSGEPVRRAFVSVTARGMNLRRSVSTDEQGRFEFRDLPKGEFHLSASKSGFVQVQLGQRGPQEAGRPLQLAEGEVYDRAVIALPRGGVIAGRITDEFGDPIADAMVSAMQYRWTPGGRRLVPARPAHTNDLGQFRLHGLAPGEYVVSATYRGPGLFGMVEDTGTGYAPTYFPGTHQPSDATSITVHVGQEASAEFQLFPARLSRIRGTVIDTSGKPAGRGVMVMASPADGVIGPGGSGASVEADGSFTIAGLAPGAYHLMATSAWGPMGRSGEEPVAATADVAVGGDDVDGVVLTLRPGAVASGEIVVEGTGAAIKPGSVNVQARPTDLSRPIRGMFSPPARVNDDLSFELTGLFGRHVLMVSGLPPGWYLKGVTLRGTDVTDAGFTTEPGRRLTGLQVVVTDRVTALTGEVADRRGEPVTDFTVVAFAEDPDLWTSPMMRHVRSARSNQEGRFRLEGLPPGRYHAVALEFADMNELMNPDLLRRLADEATMVTLAEGEPRTVRLTLIRP
jgi:hypothetical protein